MIYGEYSDLERCAGLVGTEKARAWQLFFFFSPANKGGERDGRNRRFGYKAGLGTGPQSSEVELKWINDPLGDVSTVSSALVDAHGVLSLSITTLTLKLGEECKVFLS
jgi:hypothetical protein